MSEKKQPIPQPKDKGFIKEGNNSTGKNPAKLTRKPQPKK